MKFLFKLHSYYNSPWKLKKPLKLNMRIEENNPEKGNTAKRFCFDLISSYSSAIVMKTAWY